MFSVINLMTSVYGTGNYLAVQVINNGVVNGYDMS